MPKTELSFVIFHHDCSLPECLWAFLPGWGMGIVDLVSQKLLVCFRKWCPLDIPCARNRRGATMLRSVLLRDVCPYTTDGNGGHGVESWGCNQ